MTGLWSESVLVWFVVGLLVSQAGVIFLLLTRRRVAEQERVDSEKLFRQIVDSSPIGICIVSDGNFVFVNQAYVTMFGYESAAEIVGRPVEELYAPEESSRQRRYAAERAAGHPVPTNYDVKGQKKDGSIFSVSAWVSRSKFQGKHSSLGFVIDRSVEKDLRTRLDHVNRMEAIGTLAGGIAHDFNNILTAIIGYSELAHLRCQGNEPVCSDLRQVLSAGHRAKGLVQQILTFSRNQKGELELVRLSELVEEVVDLVRASLPTTIDIRLDLRSQAQILGNAVQIHQLLMNLCANAQYELRGKRGILEISLQDREDSKLDIVLFPELKPGRYVQLTVADNGPGIPEAIRERIFEPFFTTKKTGEGTGMGLSQVHGIVSAHGGFIRVDNRSSGGAVFTLLLPIPDAPIRVGENRSEAIVGGMERILVVDDEASVALVTGRILARFGYRVEESADSQTALAMFQENPGKFDLVISDLSMPSLSGDKLIEAVLKIRPDLPVILWSGYAKALEDAVGPRLDGVVLLEKPVSQDVLARTVRRLLDRHTSS